MSNKALKQRVGFDNRYRNTRVYIDDFVFPGRRRFGTWKIPNIDMTEYDRYVVTRSDLMRVDLIAYRFYKNVHYWWMICLVNNIANPLEDLEVGMTLKIPKIDNITRALGEITD